MNAAFNIKTDEIIGIPATGEPDWINEDYADIPEVMKLARRWLLWKSIPNVSGKKPKKVPYYATGERRSGALDSPEDIAKFDTFANALASFNRGNYAGLGFALGSDGKGYWQGVDLDNVLDHPGLEFIADDLPGYTELSPSGKGSHAIGYGEHFASMGSNDSGIEAYAGGRFFTVTGEGAGTGNLCCIADYVERVLRPIHARKTHVEGATANDQPEAQAVSPDTVQDLRSALLFMRSDDYNTWINRGLALKALGDVGRGLWIEHGSMSAFFDAAESAQKWETFKPTSIGYQSIFAEAQRLGWVNPRSKTVNDSPPTEAAIQFGPDDDVGALFDDLVLRNEDILKMADAEFLIPDMIVRGHMAAYVAPANGGKTTIFVYLCEKLSKMGLKVMYINVDGSPGDLKRHYAHSEVHNYKVIAPDARDGKSTADVLAKLQAIAGSSARCDEFVFIFDTLKKFIDVINKREAKGFYKLLRGLTVKGATVCLLGHCNKYVGDDGKTIFEGTGDLRNDMDELIYLDVFKNEVSNTVEVTTRPDKVRAEFSSKSYVINLDDRSVSEPDSILKIFSKEQHEVLDAIKEAIISGCRNQKEIVEFVIERTTHGDKRIRKALKKHSQGVNPEIVVTAGEHGRELNYSLPPSDF